MIPWLQSLNVLWRIWLISWVTESESYFVRATLPHPSSNQRPPDEATAASAAKSLRSLQYKPGPEGTNATNASRDIHRTMEQLGYSLPVPVNPMDHVCMEADSQSNLTSYHIKPESWVEYLMNESPDLLCGWNGNYHENFGAFWASYKAQHPPHEVFTKHAGNLGQVVPLLLHRDEGRAQ